MGNFLDWPEKILILRPPGFEKISLVYDQIRHTPDCAGLRSAKPPVREASCKERTGAVAPWLGNNLGDLRSWVLAGLRSSKIIGTAILSPPGVSVTTCKINSITTAIVINQSCIFLKPRGSLSNNKWEISWIGLKNFNP